ncbi:MAG: response regulator [Minisyncoccales bacterium]
MKKIFIVEDDPFLVDIYVTKFEEKGYSVEAVRDGEEALGVIKEREFDIIILDINLPKMSGWDVLRRLRENDKSQESKVIILSNAVLEEDSRRMMDEFGVSKYIVKIYYTPEEVVKEVEECLHRESV